ncbi:MAG: outer membrane lipoprotein carrier protein LolA, partial [Calothrix sp. SM1_5_4]|nr:outer membrane lipoprotein carrier protein LolA [Calothrix sp. SM1_5_4]
LVKSCLAAFFVVAAVSGKGVDPAAEVNSVLKKYRQAPALKAKVRKTVVQEVMGTRSESEGDFYFSKGKLRLDFVKPERSTLVYDGKNVWLESRLDARNIQVSRLKSTQLRKTDSLLAALFDKTDVLTSFKFLKRAKRMARRFMPSSPKIRIKRK